ncbi:hypothetical protein GCM10010252_05110 [Streptomyces aureoverticillatus]|nr:hypothetical protein GCM10010252_05110 [Streptomyces aureoverticillatus]
MVLGGVGADGEGRGDLRVGEALADEFEHFELARGQGGEERPRLVPRRRGAAGAGAGSGHHADQFGAEDRAARGRRGDRPRQVRGGRGPVQHAGRPAGQDPAQPAAGEPVGEQQDGHRRGRRGRRGEPVQRAERRALVPLADHQHAGQGAAHQRHLPARLVLVGDAMAPLRLQSGAQLRPFRSAACDDTDRYHSCPP